MKIPTELVTQIKQVADLLGSQVIVSSLQYYLTLMVMIRD
jgi:hypothetical protein